jgi:transposase
MVRRHISNESKEQALSMSLQGISDIEIRKLTGISERSVKRLRRAYRNTSTAVSSKPVVAPGRPRLLSSMEVQASYTGIHMMCMSLTCRNVGPL